MSEHVQAANQEEQEEEDGSWQSGGDIQSAMVG